MPAFHRSVSTRLNATYGTFSECIYAAVKFNNLASTSNTTSSPSSRMRRSTGLVGDAGRSRGAEQVATHGNSELLDASPGRPAAPVAPRPLRT